MNNQSKNSNVSDELLYEFVMDEMEQESELIKGLWAKALAHSEGNDNKAKSLYMQYRVQAIKDQLSALQIDLGDLSKEELFESIKNGFTIIPEKIQILKEQKATINAEENTVPVENSTEVPTPLSGWLLLIPVIAWVLYKLGAMAGGNIGLMFGFMTVPNILAEALGGAIAIVGLPLIVTGLIYGVKKANGIQYTNFIKHTLIASIVLLAIGIAGNVNTIRDEQQIAAMQTTTEVVDPTAAVAEKTEEYKASLEQECKNGQASSCTTLGQMYDFGQRVVQNNFRAVDWYQKGCVGGDADGCNSLGVMYSNGKGVQENDVKAVELYRKACDSGYFLGCSNLGHMYQNGEGVEADNAKAIKYYQKACEDKTNQESGILSGCEEYEKLRSQGY